MTRTPRLFLYAAAVTTATALAGIVSTPATTVASGTTPLADALTCDMAQYKSIAGLTATVDQNVLTVAWNGQSGSEMRTRYAIAVYLVIFGSIIVAAYKMGMVHERPVVISGGKPLGPSDLMTPTTLEAGSVLEIREDEKRDQ